MNKKKSAMLINKYFKYLILLVVFYLIYHSIEYDEYFTTSVNTRTLKTDGFCVLYDEAYCDNSSNYPCKKLHSDILRLLPDDYVFIDYVYKINNVALSTFHRDVTSSKTIYKTNYPVYTLILYKYDGELLSLCPGSNFSYPFVWSNIVNISGKKGTAFLFDCDLLHAGCVNSCKYREVIQYKICHASDLIKLSHLQGINKIKTEKCEMTMSNVCMRKMSYYFEFPINYCFYPLMIKRDKTNGFIGLIQSFIPITYYNN